MPLLTRRDLSRGLSLALAAALVIPASTYAQNPPPTPAPAPAASPSPAAAPAPPAPPATPAPRRGPKPGDVQKVFVLKHVQSRPMAQLLEVFPAAISYATSSDEPKALAVSAAPAVLAAIEQTIARLDVPSAMARNVEVNAYVLESMSHADASATRPPADLDAVVAQLGRAFSHPAYRLADRLFARCRAGSTFDTGSFDGPATETSARRFSIRAAVRIQGPEDAPLIRLAGLRLNVHRLDAPSGSPGPAKSSFLGSLESDIDVPSGQRVIVGKIASGDPATALFLVLTAKVVD